MEIVNSIMPMSDVEALAANGQKLRVAVTKTSAQGKAAQSATPNLMSFSTDENSVWFNGKMYGVHRFNNVSSLNTNSTAEQVLSALNVSKSSELHDLAHKGVLFIDTISGNTIVKYEDGDGTFQLYVPSSDSRSIKRLTITVSSNKVTGLTTISHLIVDDIRNTLTSTETNKALSAAMGKKLQDEKLAKTDVVNNLTTTDPNKALSAAQGEILSYKFKHNYIPINFSAINNTSDSATIKGYMGGIDGNALVTRLTSGATLIDSSSENWVITPQEVSTSKVVFVGLKLQSFRIATKTITVTISGSNYTNVAVTTADRYVPSVVNNLASSDTANALSAAQGKALNDKISALGSVCRIKGSKTNISEVLALTDAKVGDVWNVTNAFTLGGKPYPANTNVVCTTATSSSDHDEGNWDPLGGTVDLSTYVPKSDIVDNLSTSDSKKPLSARQGLALATMITELKDNKETYQLLKTLESGTLSTQSGIDAILGPYSSFNTALNAGKVIHGVYKDNTNRMNTVAFSAFNDTTNSRVRMFAVLNNSTLLYIQATYSGTNWTSATTSEESFSASITIE
jgi:hypothetical protein